MNRKIFFILIIAIFAIGGCSFGKFITPNYYILQYNKFTEDKSLIQKEPLPHSVLINDATIPQNYNRKQIVIRHFGPKITYAPYDLWGVRLSQTIPDFLAKRLENYNIFKQVSRNAEYENSDLMITTNISNIEYEKGTDINQAHIVMDFYLRNISDGSVLVHHGFEIEKKLAIPNFENFVIVINNIILNETDEFIKKILTYYHVGNYKNKELNKTIKLVQTKKKTYSTSGTGSILLPAISGTDNEPYYFVYDNQGNKLGTARMGHEVVLPVGVYNVRYGSGPPLLMMEKTNIHVYSNFQTIIEPDWGCLVVDIKDENRNFVKIPYEIFDMENSIGYGTEFPADEESGEQQQVWVLKPGRYKVTINNQPINTYKDFTTVYVEKGKKQTLQIIVNSETEGALQHLVGAGILSPTELNLANLHWKISSAIHANFNITSNNETDKDNPETNINFNTQMENRAIYDNGPYHYTGKNHIEFGTSKQNDDTFKISADEFDLKNTIIYYFIKNTGFYARFDLNTHFLDENYYEDNINFIKINTNGDTIAIAENRDYIRVKNSFYPLILKEGIGLNWRILNKPKASINLRTGFGLRQDLNNNYFISEKTATINGIIYNIFQEQLSTYQKGTEISLIGNFKLPLNLAYSLNADFLIPFEKSNSTTIEWENILNLKLTKFLSIDYKLKLKNKHPEEGADYLTKEHSLFLRISYILK